MNDVVDVQPALLLASGHRPASITLFDEGTHPIINRSQLRGDRRQDLVALDERSDIGVTREVSTNRVGHHVAKVETTDPIADVDVQQDLETLGWAMLSTIGPAQRQLGRSDEAVDPVDAGSSLVFRLGMTLEEH